MQNRDQDSLPQNHFFEVAARKRGVTGENLLVMLEQRLDNMVYRLGFATTRRAGRQLVGHGHIMVNGRKVTVPSHHMKANDVVSLRSESRDAGPFKDIMVKLKDIQAPTWLALDKTKFEGKIVSAPKDVSIPFDVNMVVDYYLR